MEEVTEIKLTKSDVPNIDKSSVNARELVLEMLLLITAQKEYSHMVVRAVLDKYNYLRSEEKSFIKRLCEGTVERMIQIDYVLNQFSNIKVNKMKPVIRNILRMGVYQILFMDAVPDSAACNEAVKLAEKKKFLQLKGFVNGILRNIARKKEEIEYPSGKEHGADYLSVIYSMPKWIVDNWLADYGWDTVTKMLQGFMAEHAVTVRIEENLGEAEHRRLVEEIAKAGIAITAHPYLQYAYRLENLEGVQKIPGFREGKLMVQDVSSMLVAEAADIQEFNTILDVCAAPGGKALHAAAKLKGSGRVAASDVSQYKVDLIQENIDRMKYHNIEAAVLDATVWQEDKKGIADIVLADVPCSGLGVIGKKSDIKYRVSPESLAEITTLQKNILKNAQAYVKDGGTLIYSTCTINKKENEEMVQWIIENYPFELESIDAFLPDILKGTTTEKGYLQVLPGIHQADGFFLARLKKCPKY